jgi:hypothetical protein
MNFAKLSTRLINNSCANEPLLHKRLDLRAKEKFVANLQSIETEHASKRCLNLGQTLSLENYTVLKIKTFV